MNTTLDQARSLCPKHMTHGPCGGVRPGGGCEADATLLCPFPRLGDALPWQHLQPEGAPRRLDRRTLATLNTLAGHLFGDAFVVIAELWPPDSADLAATVHRYLALGPRLAAVNIADSPLASPHVSSLATAALFERHGLAAIMNLTCRDRNRIALQAELMGAAALGVQAVFCITGDHPALGDHRHAGAVYDLDSFGLIRLARRLRDEGTYESGRPITDRPRWLIGAAGSPFSLPTEIQAERAAAKVHAGADFIQTQAVFDADAFRHFPARLMDLGALEQARLIAGVGVVTTLAQAAWLNRDVPGAHVPEHFIASLQRTPPSRRRAAALRYAADLIAQLRAMPGVSGILLFAMEGDVESLGELLALLPA